MYTDATEKSIYQECLEVALVSFTTLGDFFPEADDTIFTSSREVCVVYPMHVLMTS
jgi:hypothetical protein